jgi:ABC-type Fe3+/spermidine/putrescine transport system ATPase subunit
LIGRLDEEAAVRNAIDERHDPARTAEKSAGPRPAIEVRDARKSFGDFDAVAGVSFDVPEGSFTTLLGESGSGKSTTLRLLAGLESLDSGEISLRGAVVSSRSAFVPPERRKLGLVFQSYALWPHMTVFDQVAYPLKVQHETKTLNQKVDQALDLVGLAGLGHRYPAELSGGQQQRVALARAVVYEPNVLLLDEPLSNLDAKLREHMRRELRQLHQRLGISTVYVTHDQLEALSLSDQVIVMSKGKIIERGTPEDVYERPHSLESAKFVGASNVFAGVELSDGVVRIVLGSDAGFPYTLLAGQRLAPGQRAIVGVKPEDVRIDGSGPGDLTLDAAIESVSYYGSYVDVAATVRGERWRIRSDKKSHHVGGSDSVVLTVRQEALSVFPVDEPAPDENAD